MPEKISVVVKSPFLRKLRKGRGFSKKEIEAAGITLEQAKKLGIPIDRRRKSAYEENIKVLKNIVQK